MGGRRRRDGEHVWRCGVNHTPEPWELDTHPRDVISASGKFIARAQGRFGDDAADANARRIVACVNALAGIPDPAAFVKAARALADDVDCMLETDASIAAFRAADKPQP